MGKKRRPLFTAIAIGCAVLVAGPSWAATIEPGSGDLTINQGQGFKPAKTQTRANIGDSVMVGPGGTATIVYDDGCRVNVQPGAVATIAPLSPCASGSNAADMGVPAATGPNYYQQNDSWGWAVGALVFGGALAGAIILASKKNGTTAPFQPASGE